METKLYKTVDLVQGSDEWHTFRRDKIGGSDIPVIMNASPYRKRSALLAEKASGVVTLISEYQQRIMQEGHVVEEAFRADLNEAFNLNLKATVVQSIENENFFASLDCFEEESQRLIEVKSTRSIKRFDEVKTGKIPTDWFMQINWQMGILGIQKSELAVIYLSENGFVRMTVNFDAEIFVRCKKEAQKFLNDVEEQKNKKARLCMTIGLKL